MSINTTPHPWLGVWVQLPTWYQIRFRSSPATAARGTLPPAAAAGLPPAVGPLLAACPAPFHSSLLSPKPRRCLAFSSAPARPASPPLQPPAAGSSSSPALVRPLPSSPPGCRFRAQGPPRRVSSRPRRRARLHQAGLASGPRPSSGPHPGAPPLLPRRPRPAQAAAPPADPAPRRRPSPHRTWTPPPLPPPTAEAPSTCRAEAWASDQGPAGRDPARGVASHASSPSPTSRRPPPDAGSSPLLSSLILPASPDQEHPPGGPAPLLFRVTLRPCCPVPCTPDAEHSAASAVPRPAVQSTPPCAGLHRSP